MINKKQNLIEKLRYAPGKTEFFEELKKHFDQNKINMNLSKDINNCTIIQVLK